VELMIITAKPAIYASLITQVEIVFDQSRRFHLRFFQFLQRKQQLEASRAIFEPFPIRIVIEKSQKFLQNQFLPSPESRKNVIKVR
jgi:hypothetical protein